MIAGSRRVRSRREHPLSTITDVRLLFGTYSELIKIRAVQIPSKRMGIPAMSGDAPEGDPQPYSASSVIPASTPATPTA
jgi:hypothetical protein